MIGYNTYTNEQMDSTIVSGSNDYALILGDFNYYKIIDRIGIEIMYEPMVKGSNQRPTGQAGWFAFWRTGADVLSSSAFKVLRV
jgi:HK97 family phage major capsid protein